MGQPLWTPYAQEMALRYVLGLSPNTAPGAYYFALFSVSADPVNGLLYELSGGGYARQRVYWNAGSPLDITYHLASTGTPTFNFSAAGSFSGVRIMDSSTGAGNTLWWQDLDTEYDFDAGASVPILTSAIQVGLINPS